MDAFVIVVGLQAVFIHYRWHHAADADALDRDCAVNFPLLDHVFGTAIDRGGREMVKADGLRGGTVPPGYLRQFACPLRRSVPGGHGLSRFERVRVQAAVPPQPILGVVMSSHSMCKLPGLRRLGQPNRPVPTRRVTSFLTAPRSEPYRMFARRTVRRDPPGGVRRRWAKPAEPVR